MCEGPACQTCILTMGFLTRLPLLPGTKEARRNTMEDRYLSPHDDGPIPSYRSELSASNQWTYVALLAFGLVLERQQII